jgi:hypothetical protein
MLVGWPLADAAGGRTAPAPPSALRPGLPTVVDAVVLRPSSAAPAATPAPAPWPARPPASWAPAPTLAAACACC